VEHLLKRRRGIRTGPLVGLLLQVGSTLSQHLCLGLWALRRRPGRVALHRGNALAIATLEQATAPNSGLGVMSLVKVWRRSSAFELCLEKVRACVDMIVVGITLLVDLLNETGLAVSGCIGVGLRS
jgi:hypothetical protein